jgi:outer membrane receptor protein involved in Fe transport
LVFIENAGDAEVDGVDLDFTWLPTANLTLSGGASFVNNELTRINSQLVEIVAPVGSRLPWTPEFRANLRARYDFRLESMQADAYVRGGIIYTGDSLSGTACNAYLVEDVTRQVYGRGSGLKIQEEGGFCGQPLSGDDLASVVDKSSLALDGSDQRFKAARYVQRSYTLVNVAAGMERDSWSAELYVNNLFDKNAETQINTADYTPSVSTNRPRTVGLRLGYRFE